MNHNYNNEPLIYAETLAKYSAIHPAVDTNVSAAFIKDPRVIKTHDVDFFCLDESQEDFVRELNTTINNFKTEINQKFNNFKTEINNTVGNIPTYGIAKSNALGLIKVGYTTNGKYYKVDVDTEGNAFVNVPWEAGGGITEITKQMLKSVLEGNDDSSYYLGGDLLWHQVPAQQASGDTLNAPLKQINEIGAPTSSDVILKYNGTKWVYESISNLGGGGAGGGTITSITAGDGLITADGNSITTSGTIKANLRSYTRLSGKPANTGEEDNKIYPVSLDSEGKLSVNVPWVPAVSGGDAPIFSAAYGGPTEDASLAFSGTFVVPYVSQNSAGQVTVSNKTMTLPAAPENIILNEPLSTINSAGLGAPTEAGQVLSWTGSAWNYTIPSSGGNGGYRPIQITDTTGNIDNTQTLLSSANTNPLWLEAGCNIQIIPDAVGNGVQFESLTGTQDTNSGRVSITGIPRQVWINDVRWPSTNIQACDSTPLNFKAGFGIAIDNYTYQETPYVRITNTAAYVDVISGTAEKYPQYTLDDGNPYIDSSTGQQLYVPYISIQDEDINLIHSVIFVTHSDRYSDEGSIVRRNGEFRGSYTNGNGVTYRNIFTSHAYCYENDQVKYIILKTSDL